MFLTLVCFIGFFVALFMFIKYWWKKRKARLAAGEDYQNDKTYKDISARKSFIGLMCFLSFMGMTICANLNESNLTPEEKAAYQAKREQEKIEAQRLAEEETEEPGLWDRAKKSFGLIFKDEENDASKHFPNL